MRITRLPLLLLLGYVCLDIANPLMPGAVQLVHGTIQVVEADRARTGGDAHIPATLTPARLMAIPDRGPSPLRLLLRSVRRTVRLRPLHPKRPFSRASDIPSGEDHEGTSLLKLLAD